MQLRLVLVHGVAAAVFALAMPAMSETLTSNDPILGTALEALPDVIVHVPSDRTEFSIPAPLPVPAAPFAAEAEQRAADQTARRPASTHISAPDLPDVVVALPAPYLNVPQVMEPANEQPIAASAPDAFPTLPNLPVPADVMREIAVLPDRVVPVIVHPETPKAVVIAPPVAAPAQIVSAPVAPTTEPSTIVPPASVSARSAPPVSAQPGDWRARQAAAFDRIAGLGVLPQPVLQSLRGFYEGRNGQPVFVSGGTLNDRAHEALKTIDRAGEHGLDPRRFARLKEIVSGGEAEEREVAMAALAVVYARDARGARLNPQAVSRLITATPTLPVAADVIEKLSHVPDVADALESWNPQHEGYRALKAQLQNLRGDVDHTASIKPKLAFGDVLWVGMSDARVPLLREMLALPPGNDLVYDKALSEAVKSAQRQRGLRVNGRLDRRTVAALGGGDGVPQAGGNLASDIIANMERWRWLPTQLGDAHVFVNVPAYALEMKRNGRTVFETRVVVGKATSPTPIFSHTMEYLVVNPYWNVPSSIAMKEYLPLLQANPYALQARGLQMVSRGKVVDPATVNWASVGRSVAIRQPPGERNALGNIKFMFPNDHAVYLHDTPSRRLFSSSRRAFSHGCVRVQNPFALASHIMGWGEGRLRGMVGGGERRIDLPSDVEVHLAYFTLEMRDGALVSREDIYGHNRRTKALLGL